MKFLIWVMINTAVMTGFWYGAFEGVEWALNISLFWLWITAIDGSLLGLIKKENIPDMKIKTHKLSAPMWLSNTYDVIMLSMIASQSYYVLAFFYLNHMIGLNHFNNVLKEYRKDLEETLNLDKEVHKEIK